MVLQSIRFNSDAGELEVLDQLLLPEKTQYIKIKGVEDGWSVINKMQVRVILAFADCKHLLLIYLRLINKNLLQILGSRRSSNRNRWQSLARGRDLEGGVSRQEDALARGGGQVKLFDQRSTNRGEYETLGG